jgi:hypothetical protein
MHNLTLPAPFDRFLADLLARKGVAADGFSTELDHRDELFFGGVLPGYGGDLGRAGFRYFESSLRTFDIVAQLARHLGGFEAIGPVLDFGSGWGRLTRRLVTAMPPERVWVADLYAEAVAWQAETFGVNGVCSVTRPDRFALPGPFSIVFSASVFSHLPDGLFQAWLARLYALLAPGGLLALSVHPTDLLAPQERGDGVSLVYHRHSESRTLSPDIYGMGYTPPAYVAEAVRALRPADPPPMRAFPRGLFENQDLYVIGGPGADLSGLALDITPLGGVRPVGEAGGGAVRLEGWGIDFNPGSQITRVEVSQGSRALGAATLGVAPQRSLQVFPHAPNPPVGWSLTVPRAELAEADVLRVALHSARSERVAYAYAAAPDGAGDLADLART